MMEKGWLSKPFQVITPTQNPWFPPKARTLILNLWIVLMAMETITVLLQLGEQVWMAENLKTTKYRNGTPIEYPGNDNNAWQYNTTGAYAWYDNDISWKDSYGALYNWHAVNNTNGLCPTRLACPQRC
jgi:hypothetical protein